MRWLSTLLPFVSKALHALEVGQKDARIADLEQQVEYWRSRCERLMDAALVRAGAIHEPTFVDRKTPETPADKFGQILANLTTTEIDSTKKKGAA